MTHRRNLVNVLGALAIPLACFAQQPPAYPSKPVRLIVPYAAGGPVDSMARLLVPRLVETWGQQVVIDNRAGANSIVGSEVAARAAPDGYNLVLISASFTVNATLYPKLPFDPIRDFTPITLVASGPGLLVTHPSLPVRNLKELIAFAKSKPGALSYGSAGSGAPTSHLGMELLKSTAGIDIVHVPYKSMAPALIDILGGQVQMGMPTINAVLPHIRSGRLRAIGVSSLQRSATAPEVPTLAEAGMPGYEAINWFAILGPSGFPPAIAEKIHADTAEVLKSPELRERIGAAGMEPKSIPPSELAGYIKSEIAKWGKAVKASGAKPE
ncbi:MAG TPA: tripartite tricarboxylate transporter substrate binding protein [Burkholderiales bacterium]|nr:tripartite tricarboxylate transporter substrate binding protein [Burkholderiales bacterium]